jgi:hypothetical protein
MRAPWRISDQTGTTIAMTAAARNGGHALGGATIIDMIAQPRMPLALNAIMIRNKVPASEPKQTVAIRGCVRSLVNILL